jgi:Flp pilus assembly pilin Flp
VDGGARLDPKASPGSERRSTEETSRSGEKGEGLFGLGRQQLPAPTVTNNVAHLRDLRAPEGYVSIRKDTHPPDGSAEKRRIGEVGFAGIFHARYARKVSAIAAANARRRTQMKFVAKTLRSKSGQGMTEYIIIVVLIALIVLFAINKFGRQVFNTTQNMTTTVGEQVVITDLTN